MLSKLIYRCLTIALLAFTAQVGFSQTYVDASEAITILDDAIEHLQTVVDDGPVYTGQVQLANSQDNDKLSLQLMKTVKNEINVEKNVKKVMDAWYLKAQSEVATRKTKLILALDKVKVLLS
jgi:uncharacterized protein (UPF0147 family)